ncbi:hypothetical protein M5689_013888 [Euphorbia peplus]|nr:hypothetical protein M5689_013888 [Euphorbia peplus]
MATKSLIMMNFLVVVLVLVSCAEKVKGSNDHTASGPIFDFSECKSDKDCNHPIYKCSSCKHCYCNDYNRCVCIRKTLN